MLSFTGGLLAQETDCKTDCKGVSGQSFCNLKKPPEDSYPVEWRDSYIFSYPRIVTDYFSGCQTVWDEQGKKLWVTRFKNSEPIAQEWYNKDETSVFCEIKDKGYIKEGANCFDADSIRRGMKALLPTKPDPKVPIERDPREKELPSEADLDNHGCK